jgi:zinc D-Ala-D-Ala carboxypeptidase
MQYSSMPGTSRHHWGTDVDLYALDDIYFTYGDGKIVYDWLLANAANYGFCQPYTANRYCPAQSPQPLNAL